MENFYRMLEHMTNMGVLVISVDDHTVLFSNQTFRKAFASAQEGKKCEELFSVEVRMGVAEELKCVADAKDSVSGKRFELYIPEFGGYTQINVDTFLWNENREAYILYFYPKYLSGEEKFRDEAEHALNSAVSLVYPVVVAVNLTGNAFMAFESDEDFKTRIGERGNFNERFRDKLLQYIHPDDREDFLRRCDRDYLYRTFDQGENEVHLELRMMRNDGKYHWIALRFVRIHTPDKERMSCIVLIRGVDYRMNKQMELQEALDATYSAIPGGVVQFVVDERMTILNMNDAFCELVGKKREDFANGYREHIYEEDREETVKAIQKAAGQGKPFDIIYRITHGMTGRIHWVQCRGVKISEMNGLPVYLGIRIDVTELKNAQIELQEERVRVNLAIGSTGILRYEYDYNDDTLNLYYQTDDSGQLHETVVRDYCNAIRERGEVYPEDINKVLSIFRGEEKGMIEVRLRNRFMDSFGWYRMKNSAIKDSSGRNYVVGIIENINRERKLEIINQNLQEQIESVVRDSYQRIYVLDTLVDQCTVMFMGNETYKKPISMGLCKMVEYFEKRRIHPDDLDNFRTKYIYLLSPNAFKGEREELYFEFRFKDGMDEDYHWYSALIKAVKNEYHRYVCLVKCVDEIKRQEELKRSLKEQIKYKKFSEKIIDSLGVLVEFRDGDSGSHIMRTRQLTDILLKYLKEQGSFYEFTDEEIEKIATASAMHDVGKISIPDAILNKPGRFTPEEFEIMKQHTVKGYNILKNLDLGQDEEFNKYCLEICRWHHERFDGRGYPDRLVGNEIPIWSQIVGIIDVYDALVSPRVYKSAYSHEQAMEMIMNGECGNFNPELLKCIKACEKQLRACYENDSEPEA